MQVTPNAASRPAASPPAPHADTDTPADGESFASLLGAPPEAAPPAKSAGPSRDRLQAKADPARSPRAANPDAARRPSTSTENDATTARVKSEAAEGEHGIAGRTPAPAQATGSDEASVRDWLAMLMQWPAAPADAMPQASLPAGTTPPDVRGGLARAMNPGSGATDTPSGAAMNDPGQGVALGPTLDTTSAGAGWRAAAAANSPGAAASEHRSATNASHRALEAVRDTARAGEEALAQNLQASLTQTQGAAEPPAEAAALIASLQAAPRASAASAPSNEPGAMALAPAATVSGHAPTAEAVPVAVPVPLPLDDPRFSQALGTQVSLLARDGVHEASLQLNPADMGPVSVQIVLDGTQARVEFGADVARTREAIERSLPELAAALREAGLTLSGGSVSQHQAGRGQRQADADGPRGRGGTERADRTPSAAGDTQTRPARRWVRQGGLDLYA